MNNRNTHNRREFIKIGITGAAGAAVASNSVLHAGNFNSKNISREDYIYRTLGKTGLKLPIVSMGAGDTNNPYLIKATLDAGIIFLATSQYYGNGQNEEMIGGVIKGRPRDSYIIATSAMPGGVDYQAGLFTSESKAEPFIEKFEGSLKRLGLDYIDIFLLPFAARRESVFFEPILKAMEKIKKDGKARFIGIATHSYEPEALRAAVETKIYDVAMVAYNFKKENGPEIKEAIDYAAGEGMGIIAMKTMAGVYWDKEKTLPINSKAALKWVISHENVHTSVPGFTTFDQLNQNIEIMADLKLTEEEKTDLKLSQQRTPNGIFCQQCAKCIPQCPKNLDIPTLMRSYMYAYGYKNLKHAKETYNLARLSGLPCNNCDTCEVNCAMGFDVKGKLSDISKIKSIPDEFIV